MPSAALYRSEIIGDSSPFNHHRVTAFERVTHESLGSIAHSSQSLHLSQSPSASADRTKPKDIGMHYGAINKTLGERVSRALQRRLFPNTNLTRKQLQDALKVSIGTMDNLLSGHHDPSGRVLDKLIAFFRETFINEIWGAHNIHCIDTSAVQKAEAVRRLMEAQDALRRLG